MRIAERTDIGRIRSVNEDRAVVLPEKNGMVIAIIADGMGGHQAGDIASQLAIEKIREELAGLPEEAALEAQKEAIRLAVEAANTEVYRQASQREQLRGMGTTVVVSLATPGQLVVGHIGDSRAYLAANSQLTQLTEDHSLVNELLKNGQITREEASRHPRRNVLLRALGTDTEVTVDVVDHSWAEGDILLMCSDGLSNMVGEQECLAVLQSEASLENKVDELVERALEAGGDDNVTVVLIENRPAEASGKEG